MTVNALQIANGTPYAYAKVNGGKNYPNISGRVDIFPWSTGSIVKLEFVGLPTKEKNNFFGFHIHENGECNIEKDFETAGNHFDDTENNHPNHIGDLPLVYSNNGYSFMLYYTNRFRPSDVIEKAIILHEMKDDLMTDPSGNSGKRIACGVIKKGIRY